MDQNPMAQDPKTQDTKAQIPVRTGGCLCGAVTYEVTGPLRAVVNCHCIQCRRTSGHFVAASNCQRDKIVVENALQQLTWFQSSDEAERGFCRTCGSSLFWRNLSSDSISIMAGTLDGDPGLETKADIYVAYKGNYYELDPKIAAYEESDL